MAIDALFICFCEDCEVNDGVNKPYYMSKGLMVSVSPVTALYHSTGQTPRTGRTLFFFISRPLCGRWGRHTKNERLHTTDDVHLP